MIGVDVLETGLIRYEWTTASRWWLCFALAGMVRTSVALTDLADGIRAYQQERYADAITILSPLAEQGDRNAQDLLGASFEEGRGDFVTAAYWYRKAADQLQPDALTRLGELYEDGDGVPQDTQKAMHFLAKASELGSNDAQADLGEIYASVLGDNVRAARYFALAAESGNPQAQYHLGLLLLGEEGVARDVAKSWMYLSLASSSVEDAAESRDVLELEMSPQDLEHARGLLADWKSSHPVSAVSPEVRH